MPERISACSIIQTFARFGVSVRHTSDDFLIFHFPYPSIEYGELDVSDGYVFWDDIEHWADKAGIDREQFEE